MVPAKVGALLLQTGQSKSLVQLETPMKSTRICTLPTTYVGVYLVYQWHFRKLPT